MSTVLRCAFKTLCYVQLRELPALLNKRSFRRWVAPTLRELLKRSKKLGPQEPQPRAGFIEWNYRSELFAFGKRLGEDFQLPLLQTAFTQRSYLLKEEKRQRELGIEDIDISDKDNRKLAEIGLEITKDYIQAYLEHTLPNLPTEGQNAVLDNLISKTSLSEIALHLGVKDLIFSAEYPPTEDTLANTFLAIVGALKESAGAERTFLFIRDFVCTQLNQKDLISWWNIENPLELLQTVCRERQMSEPEPRLIGDSAKNTVLAAYHVGVYSKTKLLGTGFGEDIGTAVTTASLDALQTMFGIRTNMLTFNFELQADPKILKIAK